MPKGSGIPASCGASFYRDITGSRLVSMGKPVAYRHPRPPRLEVAPDRSRRRDCGTPPRTDLDLKMLFGAQGKLHHAFEQLVRRQAREIAHDQLLRVEPHEVAKLQRLAA